MEEIRIDLYKSKQIKQIFNIKGDYTRNAWSPTLNDQFRLFGPYLTNTTPQNIRPNTFNSGYLTIQKNLVYYDVKLSYQMDLLMQRIFRQPMYNHNYNSHYACLLSAVCMHAARK